MTFIKTTFLMASNKFSPSAPTFPVWAIGVALGVLAILAHLIPIPSLAGYSYEMLIGGFVLLALGTSLKGL
jgi:hypothetical protein